MEKIFKVNIEKINSEEKYRTILENANDLIAVYNEKFECEYINEKVLTEILGYSFEEIKGKNSIKTIHPEDRASSLNIFNNTFKVGQGIGQVRIKHKNGYYKWFESKGKIFRDQNGKRYVIIISRDITEQKKVEIALKESEDLHKTLIKTSPDGIIIIDEKGKIIDISKQALSLSGFENAKDIRGKSFFDFIFPKDRKRAIENLQKTLIVDGLRNEKYKFLKKDGTCYIGELNASLIKSVYGHEKIIVGIVRDITKREKAEKKLKESEEQYRNLYEKALVGLWTVRIDDGVIISANNETARIAGVKSVENLIKNFTIADFVDKKLRQELLKRLKKFNEICDYKAYLRDINGLKKEISITAKLNHDKGYIEGYLIDITEIKRIQKALQESEEKLKESEKKYREIIENTKEGYFEVDLKGNLTFFNDALCKLLGLSSEELIKMNYKDLMSEENSKRTFKVFNKVYNTEITHKNYQYELIRKDGKKIYGETSVYLRYDSNGEKIGFSGFLRDVTERKEAEEKFRIMINDLDLGFLQTKWDGTILNVNPAFCKIMGYAYSENLKNVNMETFCKNPEEVKKFVEELSEKSVVENYIIHSKDKNNTELILQVNAHLIRDNARKPIKIEGTIADITEKFKLEQKLKNSEERYRQLFENTPFSITLINQHGRVIDFNPASEKLTGYLREELIGSNFNLLSMIHQKYISILLKRLEKVRKGEILSPLDIQLYKKDGSMIWIKYQSSLVKIGNKTLIQIIFHDISKQKKVEQKLIESEEKFRRIFRAIPDMFFLVSGDSTILDYRGKEEDLYMPPEAFLGRRMIDILPNHLGKLSSNAIKKTIDTQRPTLIEYNLPIRGKTRYFEARNLYFAKDQVAIFVREISERKNAEFLVKKEIEKLKELDQIRKDLISRVSHELKTPLIPICGGAELLLLSYKAQLGKEAEEIIKMIEKGGKRLENLVEKLLEITRIEYKKLELEKRKSDLSDLIRNCSNEMKYLIKERNITLNLDLPNNLYIDIDCLRIEQVITNLLTNAIKNTPPKGKIAITLEKINNWVKITISDTGVGLNQEEMERLFTRFGKIERYEKGLEYIDIQGSGLGLFISKEIVNLHGGQIWAESQGRNKGSNFIVKIPINLENV
ncbi:MAG: PAS domain S-box protein [Promethearchaeota archaeon]